MHTLPLSFALLTCVGFWRPINWSANSFKYWIYNIYTIFMVSMLYAFTFCGLMDALIDHHLDNLLEKFSLFISVIGVCIKVTNVLINRQNIISVTNMLLNEQCIPRDSEELAIKQKFDQNARVITIYCEILNETTVFFATVAQFGKFLETRTLPLANWTPYDHTSSTMFWITLLHQTFGLMVCANSSVAHETIISGLMIQICAQLEILCHRARILPMLLEKEQKNCTSEKDLKRIENRVIGELIEYHLYVYKFAQKINDVFTLMIFMQFTLSSTVLCMSVYKLSTKDLISFDFLWTFCYLACMLIQLFLYCWYGNEVTLRSKKIGDAFYGMNWISLKTRVIKSLTIIMARTTRSIEMNSLHIVKLSAKSFMTIIKVSYSAYNVLQTSS
ncbi:PREDICTED: odorant receptor Or1-like [Polistes dominula]|uniref:Odorant receptor n=1 Tax=Polistes dominula TaxID=743375 RepID=A0ABM1IK24_POLDO|nr:PREDICTED: odorant receptor Or1-like [Polistes dominula]